MRVYIDGTIFLSSPIGGGFIYLNALLPRLSKYSELEVSLLTENRTAVAPPTIAGLSVERAMLPTAPWFPAGKLKSWLGKCRRGLERRLWDRRMGSGKDAIYHSIYYDSSPVPRIPMVMTIYDLVTELFPDIAASEYHQRFRDQKARIVRGSSHYIAISATTKRDLCRVFDIPESKVTVAPLGVDTELFSRAPDPEVSRAVAARHGAKRPYVLYLGGRQHHKNFFRFLEALACSKVLGTHDIVIAGATWDPAETERIRQLKLEDSLRLITGVKDGELPALYRGAAMLAYPSLYEGFGLPLLEAMASGVPVAASAVPALQEVGGDAVRYFDPKDPAGMARALEDLADPATAEHYRKLGRERITQFSWDRTAELTVAAYRRTVQNP